MSKELLALVLISALVGMVRTRAAGPDDGAASRFSHTVTDAPAEGGKVVQLRYVHPSDASRNITVAVAAERGAKMFRFTFGDVDLLYVPREPKRERDSFKGFPICFPTVNRVRDGTYTFGGERIVQQVPGEQDPRHIHGLVWDDTWRFDEPKPGREEIALRCRYVFEPDNPRFQAFPYRCTLRISYILHRDRLRVRYEVRNQDAKPLAFGLGFHPYWAVIGKLDEIRIELDPPWEMERKGAYPTGRLLAVGKGGYDLSSPTPLSEVGGHPFYYGITPQSRVAVHYESIGLVLRQVASDDFKHLIVWNPARKKRPFFSLENQTSAANAHNLYAAGFEEAASLRILPPGLRASGHVDLIPERKP